MDKNNKILPDWSETNAIKLEKERREILSTDQLLKRAQKRNDMRARKLPPEIVQGDWEKAMKSAKEYKSLFKRDFIEITNDDTVQALDAKANQLFSKMMTWTSKYPSNKLALKWRERMLLQKKG